MVSIINNRIQKFTLNKQKLCSSKIQVLLSVKTEIAKNPQVEQIQNNLF